MHKLCVKNEPQNFQYDKFDIHSQNSAYETNDLLYHLNKLAENV